MKSGECLLNKSWFIFWLISIVATLVTAAALLILPVCFSIGAAILYSLFIVWWTIYYYKLEYMAGKNTLSIKNGVFFRRKRIIEYNSILWIMRLKMPFNKGVVLTSLHTAGGIVVIFCDFSTEC